VADEEQQTKPVETVTGMMAPIDRVRSDGSWDLLFHLQCMYRVVCGGDTEGLPDEITSLIDPEEFPVSVSSILRVEKDTMPDRSERILAMRAGARNLKSGEIVRVAAATWVKMRHEVALYRQDESSQRRGASAMRFTDQLAANMEILLLQMGGTGLPEQIKKDIVLLRNSIQAERKALRALGPQSSPTSPQVSVSAAYATGTSPKLESSGTQKKRTPTTSTASSAALPAHRTRSYLWLLIVGLLVSVGGLALWKVVNRKPVTDRTQEVAEILPVHKLTLVGEHSLQGQLKDAEWAQLTPKERESKVRQALELLALSDAKLVLMSQQGRIAVVASKGSDGIQVHLSQ